MRSAIIENISRDTSPTCYPKLKQTSDGLVVLFTYMGAGVVVQKGGSSSRDDVGTFSRDWIESFFSDFNGAVLLTN